MSSFATNETERGQVTEGVFPQLHNLCMSREMWEIYRSKIDFVESRRCSRIGDI